MNSSPSGQLHIGLPIKSKTHRPFLQSRSHFGPIFLQVFSANSCPWGQLHIGLPIKSKTHLPVPQSNPQLGPSDLQVFSLKTVPSKQLQVGWPIKSKTQRPVPQSRPHDGALSLTHFSLFNVYPVWHLHVGLPLSGLKFFKSFFTIKFQKNKFRMDKNLILISIDNKLKELIKLFLNRISDWRDFRKINIFPKIITSN